MSNNCKVKIEDTADAIFKNLLEKALKRKDDKSTTQKSTPYSLHQQQLYQLSNLKRLHKFLEDCNKYGVAVPQGKKLALYKKILLEFDGQIPNNQTSQIQDYKPNTCSERNFRNACKVYS